VYIRIIRLLWFDHWQRAHFSFFDGSNPVSVALLRRPASCKRCAGRHPAMHRCCLLQALRR
jgi:hypothetical protein